MVDVNEFNIRPLKEIVIKAFSKHINRTLFEEDEGLWRFLGAYHIYTTPSKVVLKGYDASTEYVGTSFFGFGADCYEETTCLETVFETGLSENGQSIYVRHFRFGYQFLNLVEEVAKRIHSGAEYNLPVMIRRLSPKELVLFEPK